MVGIELFILTGCFGKGIRKKVFVSTNHHPSAIRNATNAECEDSGDNKLIAHDRQSIPLTFDCKAPEESREKRISMSRCGSTILDPTCTVVLAANSISDVAFANTQTETDTNKTGAATISEQDYTYF